MRRRNAGAEMQWPRDLKLLTQLWIDRQHVLSGVEGATPVAHSGRGRAPSYIRSGTAIPRTSRASSSCFSIAWAKASREARTAGGALRIGQAA